jgi:hypothetical protein
MILGIVLFPAYLILNWICNILEQPVETFIIGKVPYILLGKKEDIIKNNKWISTKRIPLYGFQRDEYMYGYYHQPLVQRSQTKSFPSERHVGQL